MTPLIGIEFVAALRAEHADPVRNRFRLATQEPGGMLEAGAAEEIVDLLL